MQEEAGGPPQEKDDRIEEALRVWEWWRVKYAKLP